MRLTLIVFVVILVGCRKETELQKCDRLRLAATTAVTAYVDARRPEENRLEAATADLDKRYKETLGIRDQMRAIGNAIECGSFVGVATRRQLERANLDELHQRGERAVEGARLVLGVAPDDVGSIPPASSADGIKAAAALQAALAGWSATIDAAPSRPGKPWSAKQRTYLASIEQSWCALDKLVTPGIEAQMTELAERRDKLEAELDTTRKQYFAYQDTSTPGHDVSEVLRVGLKEVTFHPRLTEDPAFAASQSAINAYNHCRD